MKVKVKVEVGAARGVASLFLSFSPSFSRGLRQSALPYHLSSIINHHQSSNQSSSSVKYHREAG